jgi:hypothetical protein
MNFGADTRQRVGPEAGEPHRRQATEGKEPASQAPGGPEAGRRKTGAEYP